MHWCARCLHISSTTRWRRSKRLLRNWTLEKNTFSQCRNWGISVEGAKPEYFFFKFLPHILVIRVIFENTLFSKIALNTSLHPRFWDYSRKTRTREIDSGSFILWKSVHSRLDSSQTRLDPSPARLDPSQTRLDPSQFNIFQTKILKYFCLCRI